MNELKNNFTSLIDKTIKSYSKIEKDTGVKLHGVEGIEKFKYKIGNDVIEFMKFSREKAVLRLTSTKIKGKITSENNLKQVRSFCENNKFTKSQIETVVTIFNEANKNNFIVEVTVAK